MKANQETVIAIVVGFSLGFLVAFGIFFLPGFYKGKAPISVPSLSQSGKISSIPTDTTLSLSEPKDDQGVTEATLAIAGKSRPNSTIVVSSSLADVVVEADGQGSFSTSIAIPEGPSEIVVSGYTADGVEDTVVKKIYRVSKEIINETNNE